MNLEKLNQSIAIFANLGVLAGIIFLGVEIRQNTLMTQAQTRDAMTEKQMAFYELIANDASLTTIYIEHSDFPTPRTEDDMRYDWLLRSQFRMWENEWYQYQQGLFEAEEFLPRMELWRTIIVNSEEYRRLWGAWKSQHAPDFVEQIDAIVNRMETN